MSEPLSSPPAQGLYDPANEHDACGVGFIAHIKGKKSHEIVEHGLLILKLLEANLAVYAINPKLSDQWRAGRSVAEAKSEEDFLRYSLKMLQRTHEIDIADFPIPVRL